MDLTCLKKTKQICMIYSLIILVWDITFGFKSTKKTESARLLDSGFNFKSLREENHINLHFLFLSPLKQY